MFYEVVYENGSVSVVQGEEAEVLTGLRVQHERAKAGGQNGPQGGPASRVKRVLAYEKHPNDYMENNLAAVKVAKAEVTSLLDAYTDDNGVVNVMALGEAIKAVSHPMVAAEHPHDSRFKMEEVAELDPKLWGGE